MNEKISGLLIILISYLTSFSIGVLSYIIMEKYIPFSEEPDDNIMILIRIFISNVISTVIIWLIGVVLGTASTYDAYWSVQTPFIFICLLIKFKNVNIGNFIYLELILFWAIRLTYNYTKTFHDISYIDWIYEQIRETTGKFYQIINLKNVILLNSIG